MTIENIKNCIKREGTRIFIPVLGTFHFYKVNDEYEFWKNVYEHIYNSGKE